MLIGFCGYSNAGKTTCAKYLGDKYGYEVVAFGDIIRAESAHALNLIDNTLKPAQYVQQMKTPVVKEQFRQFMEWFGGWKKLKDPLIWVKRMDELLCLPWTSKNVIIDDVRFICEGQFVHSKGGIVIGINSLFEKERDYEKEVPSVIKDANFHNALGLDQQPLRLDAAWSEWSQKYGF